MTIFKRPMMGKVWSFLTSGTGTDADPLKPVVDAYIQDQTTPTLILPLVRQLGATTLAVDSVIDDYTIQVVSNAGMSIGHHIRVVNSAADRYYFGAITNIAGAVITLDTPVDFTYLTGSEVTFGSTNMAVNGSITPVHFHLRTGSPSIPSSVDITRLIITCTCDSAVDLNKFGNLPALARGIVFRTQNSHQYNIFNAKTNKDLVGFCYDWTPYQASNPAQAVDGFSMRLTFGGPSKLGVVLRVVADGQLGMLIQDDLTGLVSLTCTVEGHVVD